MATYVKMPSGKWQARVRIKGHKPQARTFPTKPAARRWATKREAEIAEGRHADPTNTADTTLKTVLLKYCQAKIWDDSPDRVDPPQGNRKIGQTSHHRIQILVRELGHWTLRQITPQRIAEYRDKRTGEGMAAASVIYELSVLSEALKWACKEKGYAVDPEAAKVKRPSLPPGRDRRLKPGELELLREHLPAAAYDVVEFVLATGLRRQEVCGMRWEHYKGTYLLLPKTKTGPNQTRRLTAHARQLLEAQRELISQTPRTEGAVTTLDKRHFTGYCWQYTNGPELSRLFRKACRAAGITGLTFHDLRHEAVSRMCEWRDPKTGRGLSTQQAMALTGHTDTASFMRYVHLLDDPIYDEITG